MRPDTTRDLFGHFWDSFGHELVLGLKQVFEESQIAHSGTIDGTIKKE